jgi:hypothetical protein
MYYSSTVHMYNFKSEYNQDKFKLYINYTYVYMYIHENWKRYIINHTYLLYTHRYPCIILLYIVVH